MVHLRKKKMKMASLIQSMKRLDQQVARCSRCGICQSVCPLYEITRNESDVARGKLMLLDGLMRSFFEDPEGCGSGWTGVCCADRARQTVPGA